VLEKGKLKFVKGLDVQAISTFGPSLVVLVSESMFWSGLAKFRLLYNQVGVFRIRADYVLRVIRNTRKSPCVAAAKFCVRELKTHRGLSLCVKIGGAALIST
jgi:hypothetical protein